MMGSMVDNLRRCHLCRHVLVHIHSRSSRCVDGFAGNSIRHSGSTQHPAQYLVGPLLLVAADTPSDIWGMSMWRVTVPVPSTSDRAAVAAASAAAVRRPVRVGGWGRATASTAAMVRPDGESAWERLVAAPGPRGLIARGAGSGYGDCAQDAGGVVALTDCPHPTIDIDFGEGTVTVDAGVRLRDLMQRLVPSGWTLPVLPGTTEVSVGGAIAADVHGKNHPTAGAFSACVEQLRLLTPGLGPLEVSPQEEPDVFWATWVASGLLA
jgi:FAD/FMN-containing dehydrogenase